VPDDQLEPMPVFIRDRSAFDEAMRILGPGDDGKITARFERILTVHSMIIDREVASPSAPISRKELIESAQQVESLSQKLNEAILEFMPMGLTLELSKSGKESFHELIAVNLPKLMASVNEIKEIARLCSGRYLADIKSKTISPRYTIMERFSNDLTDLWIEAGHKVKTTTGGELDQFFIASLQAVTGKPRESVSRLLSVARQRSLDKTSPDHKAITERADSVRHSVGLARLRAGMAKVIETKAEK
jgi:hypothetical protein